jgi:hypothetical protein
VLLLNFKTKQNGKVYHHNQELLQQSVS